MKMSYEKGCDLFSKFQIRTKTNGGFLVSSGDDFFSRYVSLKSTEIVGFCKYCTKKGLTSKGFVFDEHILIN